MSSHRKGLRSKRKAKRYLESEDFRVLDVEDNSKYGETDGFGIADLVAFSPFGVPYLVQVKSNRPETQKVMQEVADKVHVRTVCLTWIDYEGFREQVYMPGFETSPYLDRRIDSSEVPSR